MSTYPIYNHSDLCPTALHVGGAQRYTCECDDHEECEAVQAVRAEYDLSEGMAYGRSDGYIPQAWHTAMNYMDYPDIKRILEDDLGMAVYANESENDIRETLRETDLAARYGGEEFGVVLPKTPLREAYRVAERVRETLAVAQWKKEREALRITTSVGLAEAGPDDDEPSLLRRADKSLYAAKSRGRNRCCWHDGDSPRFGFDGLRDPHEQDASQRVSAEPVA